MPKKLILPLFCLIGLLSHSTSRGENSLPIDAAEHGFIDTMTAAQQGEWDKAQQLSEQL